MFFLDHEYYDINTGNDGTNNIVTTSWPFLAVFSLDEIDVNAANDTTSLRVTGYNTTGDTIQNICFLNGSSTVAFPDTADDFEIRAVSGVSGQTIQAVIGGTGSSGILRGRLHLYRLPE